MSHTLKLENFGDVARAEIREVKDALGDTAYIVTTTFPDGERDVEDTHDRGEANALYCQACQTLQALTTLEKE